MDFTHLHVHSHYSLLDGLAKIDELVAAAVKNSMKSVALTDHGVLYGAIEFYQKARAAGINPIIGCETYVARAGRGQKRARIDDRPFHLILLAKNQIGYKNLLKLISLAHIEGFYYKPRVDFEILQQYHEGLIALSSCLSGEVSKAILASGTSEAEKVVEKYQKVFGEENFYLELQHNPNIPEQGVVNAALRELSQKTGSRLVATNDVHYINPQDAPAQDALVCIQLKKTLKDSDRMSMVSGDYSFKSAQEMSDFFSDCPEAIENTMRIAKQCNVEIELGKIRVPMFIPPNGLSADTYLRNLAYEGISNRYGFDLRGKKEFSPQEKIVSDRLEYELREVSKMGFSPYFLIVQDFVNWAKNQGIMVGPGRGSAAGSIVSYLLKITNIDPLRYGLIFERFLNPERIVMPDIDIDFADTRRDEVLAYVANKYGHDHVAQIITFGTMAARAAVRDAGRVLGMPYTYCDHLAKLIPMFTSLKKSLETVADLRDMYEKEKDAKTIIDMASKLEGVARHASVHACGVLITSEPLVNFVPVQYVSQDEKDYVSQYSLHPVEDLGLLKLDFLGLRNLTVLEKAIDIVRKTAGVDIDLDHIPLDDPSAFDLLQRGETTGIFQLESSGMKRYLRELRPSEIDDIIAMVALYRPGPMELIPDYISGKHGRRRITYLHPKLKSILEKTQGIAIYQEQVLQIARDIAGFSLGEADVLRKAIGKKIRKLLMEQREKFVKGAVRNGVSKKIAEQLFDFVEPFAQYGFNKSHAAAYALIAYQTAYLKGNFPAQFMAALLTSDEDNIDRIAIEVDECRRMGIQVLPPDINESFSTFTVVKESLSDGKPRIRFGLKAIKNVGDNIVDCIIEERKKNGPFQSLSDFMRRVESKDLNKKSVESLAKSGAFDRFAKRADILFNTDTLLRFAKNIQHSQSVGQKSMFAILSATPEEAMEIRLIPAEHSDPREELAWEKELLGLYISSHPLKGIASKLQGMVTPIQSLAGFPSRQKTRIIGVINSMKRIITRSGEPMLFAEVEDTTATVEALVFPKKYKETSSAWREDAVVLLEGRSNDKDGEVKFIVDSVKEYSEESLAGTDPLSGHIARTVSVYVPHNFQKDKLFLLKETLKSYPGNCPLYLNFKHPAGVQRIITNTSIDPKPEAVSAIEGIIGQNSVILETP